MHESDCPELIVGCHGVGLGCAFTARRADLPEHHSTCAFAALEPFIRGQNERIHALEAENKIMRRKWDTFGVGDLPDQIAESARLALFEDSGPSTVQGNDQAPFDSAIHHLLSSYETLRSDIDRLSTSMSELDARHSMLQLNESLRIKEDFSHLNAVIGSMRVQLHWLMSTRLQGQTRANAAPAAGSSTGPSREASVGTLMFGAQQGRRLSETPDTKL